MKKLNSAAKQLLEKRLAPFVQRQSWDDEKANEWIPEYGCLLCCLVASFVILGLKSFFQTCDGYYHVFKEKGILNKKNFIVWNKLEEFYKTCFNIETLLWDGKHKEKETIKANMVTNLSIVSVDYKKNPEYKNSHWVLVLYRHSGFVIFDPWTGTVDYFPEKYLINNSIESSIFSIINIKILL